MCQKKLLRVSVEGLLVSGGVLERGQSKPPGGKLPEVLEKLSFDQYMQLEREKAEIERERLQFQLEHERLQAELTQKAREADVQVALEREIEN